jgi:hypothetical protein
MFHGDEMEMQNVVNHGLNHFIYKVCFNFKLPNKSQVVELKAMAKCME